MQKALLLSHLAYVNIKYIVCEFDMRNGNQKENIWLKKRLVKKEYLKENHAYFSCITAVEEVVATEAKERKYRQQDICSKACKEEEGKSLTGNKSHVVALGIVFDWPQHGISAFEETISKKLLSITFSMVLCK